MTEESTAVPTISVVIPTTGRPELLRAVRSAREQHGPHDVEVIVVDDSPAGDAGDDAGADVVVRTGGRRGGGFARNRGVEAGSGDLVAFLDDDDEWTPNKTVDQTRLLAEAADAARLVVSGRHVHVAPGESDASEAGPATLIAEDDDVATYLFVARTPSVRRASMYTSTLLCAREFALEVPWREDLSRHQDWDWLVRLGRAGGSFAHVPGVVVRIQTGSRRSISASADWRTSLTWANEMLPQKQVYVDFVVGQTLRYALTARDLSGVRAVLGEVASRRRLPSVGPSVIGLAGVVPRHRVERLMTRRSVRGGG